MKTAVTALRRLSLILVGSFLAFVFEFHRSYLGGEKGEGKKKFRMRLVEIFFKRATQ